MTDINQKWLEMITDTDNIRWDLFTDDEIQQIKQWSEELVNQIQNQNIF